MIATDFHTLLRGRFTSLLSWSDLDAFWDVLRRQTTSWYIYAVGEPVPTAPRSPAELDRFIVNVDELLRREHREDYCAIVYTDSKTEPTVVKIYDPNHLGVVCGTSDRRPLPGWILSQAPPLPLDDPRPVPANRSRWWHALWA